MGHGCKEKNLKLKTKEERILKKLTNKNKFEKTERKRFCCTIYKK